MNGTRNDKAPTTPRARIFHALAGILNLSAIFNLPLFHLFCRADQPIPLRPSAGSFFSPPSPPLYSDRATTRTGAILRNVSIAAPAGYEKYQFLHLSRKELRPILNPFTTKNKEVIDNG